MSGAALVGVAALALSTQVVAIQVDVARRSLIRAPLALVAATGAQPAVADVPVDPFNSMCLGFGCNSVKGIEKTSGLAKPIGEDSIAWTDFLRALDENRIARVEFVDVNMQKAYAVFKDPQTRILIGEGYPIESGNSW